MPPRPTKPPGKKSTKGVRSKQTSLRDVYVKACAETGLHPNSALLEFLPDKPGVPLATDSINVNQNYLGDKGLAPLLAVMDRSPTLVSISLSENGLRNNAIRALCSSAVRHPSLQHINVSDNYISEGAAVCLAQLLEENNRITELVIDNTKIDVEWRVRLRDLVRANAAAMRRYVMEQQQHELQQEA